jgi:hypothetical protein
MVWSWCSYRSAQRSRTSIWWAMSRKVAGQFVDQTVGQVVDAGAAYGLGDGTFVACGPLTRRRSAGRRRLRRASATACRRPNPGRSRPAVSATNAPEEPGSQHTPPPGHLRRRTRHPARSARPHRRPTSQTTPERGPLRGKPKASRPRSRSVFDAAGRNQRGTAGAVTTTPGASRAVTA